MKFKRIAIDTSKHVFTLHGVDEQERPVLRRELKRANVESFFGKQDATEVVLPVPQGNRVVSPNLPSGASIKSAYGIA